MAGPMTRNEAGPCPGRTDHQHVWLDATTLNEAGYVERHVCGYCPAQADELTEMSDAQWLRKQAENLVAYEEDAQRLRRIAGCLDSIRRIALANGGPSWDLVLSYVDNAQNMSGPSHE